jgi:hypothetical protein
MRGIGFILLVLGIGGFVLPLLGSQLSVFPAIVLLAQKYGLTVNPLGIPFAFVILGTLLLVAAK